VPKGMFRWATPGESKVLRSCLFHPIALEVGLIPQAMPKFLPLTSSYYGQWQYVDGVTWEVGLPLIRVQLSEPSQVGGFGDLASVRSSPSGPIRSVRPIRSFRSDSVRFRSIRFRSVRSSVVRCSSFVRRFRFVVPSVRRRRRRSVKLTYGEPNTARNPQEKCWQMQERLQIQPQ